MDSGEGARSLMLQADQHSGNWVPETEPDRQAVHDELERMLQNPLFSNSKRYPVLLRYLVEQTLQGNEDLLKERLLGVSVFHRLPDYDTNQDTVVRLAAGEVRKRIAQYYHQTGQPSQFEIDLRPGSYVPVFRRVEPVAEAEVQTSESPAAPEEEAFELAAAQIPARGAETAAPVPRAMARIGRWALLGAILTVLVLAAGAFGWWQVSRSAEAADRQLWTPILNEPGQVRLVIADLSAGLSYRPSVPGEQTDRLITLLRMGEIVNYRDSLAGSGLVAFLAQKNKPYTIELSSQASYTELQQGASILVGGLDNVWTMRVTEPLRYHFVRRPTPYVFAIEDRLHPGEGGWHLDLSQPTDRATEDFAIVARVFDQTTGRPVLIAAGLGANGTTAAAEFLLDPARAAELAAHAPRNWQRLNMEAVIRTQILDNHAGPPHLVARTFW